MAFKWVEFETPEDLGNHTEYLHLILMARLSPLRHLILGTERENLRPRTEKHGRYSPESSSAHRTPSLEGCDGHLDGDSDAETDQNKNSYPYIFVPHIIDDI